MTLTNYEVFYGARSENMQITSLYPFNEKARATKAVKNMYIQSIINSNIAVLSALNRIEDSLKNGNTSGGIENEDW